MMADHFAELQCGYEVVVVWADSLREFPLLKLVLLSFLFPQFSLLFIVVVNVSTSFWLLPIGIWILRTMRLLILHRQLTVLDKVVHLTHQFWTEFFRNQLANELMIRLPLEIFDLVHQVRYFSCLSSNIFMLWLVVVVDFQYKLTQWHLELSLHSLWQVVHHIVVNLDFIGIRFFNACEVVFVFKQQNFPVLHRGYLNVAELILSFNRRKNKIYMPFGFCKRLLACCDDQLVEASENYLAT